MEPRKNNLGFITGLFDLDNNGSLDIIEEALLISTINDMAEEEISRQSKGTTSPRKMRKAVDLDDLDIEGI